MDKEGRKAKRQRETRNAVIGFIIFVLLAALLVTGTIFGLRRVLQKKALPVTADTDSQSAENTENGETGVTEMLPQKSASVEQESDPQLEAARQKAAEMTLEERVAQLFFITPDALTGVTGTNIVGDTTRGIYQNYPVGGIIYMADNLQNTDQAKDMISKMNSMSVERVGMPLLLAVDEEGGSVARIAGNAEFHVTNVGDMSAIGATGDGTNAYQTGNTIGAYLKNLGFNVDFAPVADVLTNASNTAIGNRSFGSDAAVVSEMVTSELQGLGEQGIVGVVKHFPGQGGTAGDSHEGAVSLDKTIEELRTVELVPFQSAIDAGVKMIMVSHMALPGVTGDNTPASMSGSIMTDLLRGEMKFQGVIITDALNMGAITANYSSDTAAVTALAAGADMILMPEDFKTAYQGVIDAVNNGTLTEERINDAAAHVVKLKMEIQQ